MNEKYLVINAGSSSLKFSLYDMPEANELVNGYIEKIGKEDSFYTLKYSGKKEEKKKIIMSHTDAVQVMLMELLNNGFISDVSDIKGVGHRVLHGGELYSESILIDEEVLNDIKTLTKLGPLHHPGEIAGIESMQQIMPNVPQVAVFDTAFHQTMPKESYMYAVPYEWYKENGVRKYGFHGTSHKYITQKMQDVLNKPDVNLIICHIGSGESISCIKNGKCIDTSMGLTPLDGLVMGTRSGSIDPSIIQYICKERNYSVDEVTDILNNKSGLLGICGENDNRSIEKLIDEKNELGILAMNMLKNSIVKYIAQYYFELDGNVDAIIFTAGIGENGILLRKLVVDSISNSTGIKLDESANDNISRYKPNISGIISTSKSTIKVYVLPTNEEVTILNDTYVICNERNYVKKKVK